MRISFTDIHMAVVDLNLQAILQGYPIENETIVKIVDAFQTHYKRFSIITK